MVEQQKKIEEESIQKSQMQPKPSVRTRTHEEFMADQIKYE